MSDTVMLADIGGLLLLPFALLAFAFWLWMVVDCATHEAGTTMLAWLLAILFAGIIAAPLYFFLRRFPRQRSAQFLPASSCTNHGKKTKGLGDHIKAN